VRALPALCGPFFVAAGALHFARPRAYEAIVPDCLPARRALVYASGAAEALGGAALTHPATQKRVALTVKLTVTDAAGNTATSTPKFKLRK